jgi:DNA-binding response OmpR family regulator
MDSSVGHILYVENDADTRELVAYVLTRGSYTVVAVECYEHALQLARAGGFDLYMIDNRMAGGSGIELCRKLREFDAARPSCSIPARPTSVTGSRRSPPARKAIWSSPRAMTS